VGFGGNQSQAKV
jgi:hypothetical protein